jgi:hypothetical protein
VIVAWEGELSLSRFGKISLHFRDFIYRTYAVGCLNVISSDDRSEKSLKYSLANGGFRDFSSLRSSK